MNQLLCMLPPYRWWRAMRALFKGSRVHPSAVLLGQESQISLGLRCVLKANVRVDPGRQGRVTFGDRCWIAADVEVQTDSQVIFGEGTSVQRRSTINGSTRLGSGCILAPNVFISSGTHPFRFIPHLPIREQELRMANNKLELSALDRPVWVQDDCWLGANVVVCPGVTIGKGSIIGANTVVTRDVPPYSIVTGSPGTVKSSRLDWRPPMCIDPSREEDRPYLLDARLRTDWKGSYIQVAQGSPVLAVFAVPESPVLFGIAWRAFQAVKIKIGKSRVDLPKGQGLLNVSSDNLQIENGVTKCMIELASDSLRDKKLDIIKLGWNTQ